MNMDLEFENSQFLFRKAVNKDVLFQYIVIPLDYASSIYDKFGYLDIGKEKNIKVWIENELFLVKLVHSKSCRSSLQIYYTFSNNPLPTKLRKIFKSTTAFVNKYKGKKTPIPKIEESDKEYIDIELVDKGFRFICYPKGSEIPNFKRCKPSIDILENNEQDEPTKTPVVSMENKIKFLIAKGKHRGFVKESEILAILPEGISIEKIEEVFNTIVANNIELRWEE